MELSRTAPPLHGGVVAAQEWRQVAFVHWRVSPEVVAPLLPPGVVPDVFDGSSWVGLIAFRLGDARIGPLPPTSRWGSFTEVNVRLYGIDAAGRRGVVFRSLEASSLPAVIAARALFGLPYVWSRTDQRQSSDGWNYASRRVGLRPSSPEPRFRLDVAVDETRVVDDELCAAAGLPGIVDSPPDSVLFSAGVDAKFGLGRLSGPA